MFVHSAILACLTGILHLQHAASHKLKHETNESALVASFPSVGWKWVRLSSGMPAKHQIAAQRNFWCLAELKLSDYAGQALAGMTCDDASQGASTGCAMAFDDDTQTHFCSTDTASSTDLKYLTLKFASSQQVKAYEVTALPYTSDSSLAGFSPTAWTLEGSNNGGSTWTTLDTKSSATWSATNRADDETVEYQFATQSQTECPSGTQAVDSQAACTAAAQFYGFSSVRTLTWLDQWTWEQPGCSMYLTSSVFWNPKSDAVGARSGRNRICKKSAR